MNNNFLNSIIIKFSKKKKKKKKKKKILKKKKKKKKRLNKLDHTVLVLFLEMLLLTNLLMKTLLNFKISFTTTFAG